MDPLDYLIEDCWLHLFEFIPAEDKQTLCHTCETFHLMLQPEKTKWGLELILPHVLKRELDYNFNNFGNGKRKDAMKSVLKLRQVCKAWRVGFDRFCGSFEKYGGRFHTTALGAIYEKYLFGNTGFIDYFLTFFKNHKGNPFIGRTVKLFATSIENMLPDSDNEDTSEVDNERETRMKEMLRFERERDLRKQKLYTQLITQYGKEINTLTLENRVLTSVAKNCNQLNACKFLQLVLSNTPNLQNLRVTLRHSQEECINTFTEKVTEYFKLNPLPRIATLRELTLPGIDGTVANLLLETYGANLYILEIHNPVKITNSVWSNMLNLKSLRLCYTKFESTVEILQTLPSPLESLYFSEIFQYGRKEWTNQVFEIDKFLLSVQHLPLREITLGLKSNLVKHSAPFPQDFPKHMTIKSITILGLCFITRDFLQFLPQLKRLFVDGKKIHL